MSDIGYSVITSDVIKSFDCNINVQLSDYKTKQKKTYKKTVMPSNTPRIYAVHRKYNNDRNIFYFQK